MTFLCGEYRHQVDEKGRVRIPTKLKNCLDENSIVCRGSNCLYIFSGVEFTEMINKFKAVPLSDTKAQSSLRALFSSTYSLEEDSQGRTQIPTNLRDSAKLTKNIVSVGVLNRIEIWDEATYDINKDNSENFDKLIETLRQYGV